ncbi:acylphosphatase [Candidatus Bipolaricaulota bacterium]|nr:acylphosphatase [Candidatus Bipolaricaulota bacterium]MBS3814739.1 acylphosphatase [Candidatus Bipolaricaulota bacterium]MBS3825919.1 acylphosphatase [Candidatus Bipolaricaulota bacterium]
MAKQRARLNIMGKVQGVGFRANTRSQARKLGLTGWVRNLSDGSVEVVAEGEKEDIDSLISWARKGPRLADVKNVEIERDEYRDEFGVFSVRY